MALRPCFILLNKKLSQEQVNDEFPTMVGKNLKISAGRLVKMLMTIIANANL